MSKRRNPGDEPLSDEFARRRGDGKEADETSTGANFAKESTLTGLPGQGTSGGKPESSLPDIFGRYRILRPIGRGGMGTVYLAEDSQLGRLVALKTPTFKGRDSAKMLQRFSREARAAATLRHQNICPVFDFGEFDGKAYISMAFINGRPLADYVQPQKPHPERRILIVIRKLALALQEAHDQGIVHRDIKPSNVMVDERGEPIIMDFGIAQETQEEGQTRLTQTGTLIGSPAYMSPEQVTAATEKIGPLSDQYSLGVMFYELLTGELPFRGSLTTVVGQILAKKPTPPSQLRSGLDPRIEAACLKMMAKRRHERFASMRDVADALAVILREPSTLHPPNGGPSPARDTAEVRSSDPAVATIKAKGCLGRHDYEGAARVLEAIPEGSRNDGIRDLLKKARDLNDEVSFLLVEIDEAFELEDGPTALAKTVRLAELKPGHPRIRDIRERFPHDAPVSTDLNTGWLLTIWAVALIFVSGVILILVAEHAVAGVYLIAVSILTAVVAVAYWLGSSQMRRQGDSRWQVHRRR